jgi:hypothetical protein
MIDHVTYHVAPGTLDDPDLPLFLEAIGLKEVEPDDPFEHGWKVRWFRSWGVRNRTTIHLVEGTFNPSGTLFQDQDDLVLGHFCVKVGATTYAALRATRWLDRDSGSGRIWMKFNNLRVEVRP